MDDMLKKILADEGKKIKDNRVLSLYSEDKQDIIDAINSLIKEGGGSYVEDQLCTVLEYWQYDGSYAPMWVMVTLGHMRSRRSIPLILNILDSDADIFMEAASDALTQIVQKFGESVIGPIEEFIEQRLANDPYSARLYAYEPIASLTKSERAKNFLIRMFQEDDTWKGSIAHDLARFKDKKLLHLLRRAIEFADKLGDDFEGREFREAYCMLDGVKFSYMGKQESWGEPWQERWSHILNELGKTEAEIEKERNDHFTKALKKDKKIDSFEKKIDKEVQIRDTHPLCDFDIEIYLSIRQRNAVEESFEELLRILGVDKNITTESIQTLMDRTINFQQTKDFINQHYSVFPSQEAMNQFGWRLNALWEITPKEPYQGLSPADIKELPVSPSSGQKIGRNESCVCGSGKKYKKCCGK